MSGVRFGILGAGAIGSTFGGLLARAGHEVMLLDTWREHVDAIREHGLTLRAPDTEIVAHPHATSDPAELQALDYLLVSTKSSATRNAAASVAHAVHPGTVVVTLQNGLGNDRALAEVLSDAAIVPGTTVVAAQAIGPGLVSISQRTAQGESSTHVGAPLGMSTLPDTVHELARILTSAGLPTEAIADAQTIVWQKLVMSCSMTTASAVLQCKVVQFWSTGEGRAIVRAMFDEVLRLAHAEGVALDEQATWQETTAVLDAAGDVYTSTSVDVMAGRPTEIEALSLEVSRRSAEHGLDAPVSRTVGQFIKVLEQLPAPDTAPA
jgi:2-dehydropantoate 2-reductase